MVERPILFSGAMVRAILEGRKSQTRRVVKHPSIAQMVAAALGHRGDGSRYARFVHPEGGGVIVELPWMPKDHLWVRETWAPLGENDPSGKRVVYAAGPFLWGNSDPKCGVTWPPPQNSCDAVRVARWHPSIHMPRWASRITLEVTGVRVERLNDISEEDAMAEGIKQLSSGSYGVGGELASLSMSAPDAFRSLWESINGPGSWAANPWVWAITFKRVTP